MADDLARWTEVLGEAWGIDATLEPLDGEFDLNLCATARDGRRFVLKIMRDGCSEEFVDLLVQVHTHIRARDPSVPVATVVRNRDGALWCVRKDPDGADRMVWLLTMLDGVEYARFRPRSLELIESLGATVARMDRALADFSHPATRRAIKWDLSRAGWITGHLDVLASADQRAVVAGILARCAEAAPALRAEPQQVVHNDLNDWNVLVALDGDVGTHISGIIDFGDAIDGPVVAEIAVAGAYLVLDHPQPERALAAFVAGYHHVSPLAPAQIDLIWPLLCLRLAVSVVNSALMRRERPDDPYVVVSEAAAWRFLEHATARPESQLCARLRAACKLPASDAAARVLSWLDLSRGTFARVLGLDLATLPVGSLAVATSTLPSDPLATTADEARRMGDGAGVGSQWIGGYGEPRALYTAPAFMKGVHPIADRRSVHLGVDIFLAAGNAVSAPADGIVEVAEYREAALDYGGLVVLRHQTPHGDSFWTLYGHLSRLSVAALRKGQHIARGERIAALGTADENGGWDPHLHFQVATSIDSMGTDWPGVADPDELPLWLALCPNPAALLNLEDARVAYRPIDESAVRRERNAHFATNLRLSYRQPCLFVRGWKHYLFDQWGRTYLDAYNNVPHVGHSHPRLRAVASDQMALLNSNTRYLHPAQVAFAEALLAKLPDNLSHVFLVNSGSEANELALRLARTHTRGRDMIVADHGYHGNSTGAYDLSAYKFNKPGGGGRPEWVQVVPVADTYRGAHRGADAAARYAGHVDDAVTRVHDRGGRLAGFIAETLPSVAGQIIPPAGYLRGVYERIRAAGGVCIADEVQTGLGRLGEHFWGFEQQAVRPDIVVLGKPLGNGHPIGAVITTAEIARSFDNGIEFFSTFGGSTLACRVGLEVLRIVAGEGLQENARRVGAQLLDGLRELQEHESVIGEVRGMGLFIGVDLVTDRESREPATAAARRAVNRLREERILIGTEGPADNVLKIRPPLSVQPADAQWLVDVLRTVLAELPG